MSFSRLFTLVCLLLLSLSVNAEPNKQALKYIREKTFDKAEEQILKSLEKDSINPAGHYLAGMIHIQTSYSNFDIDSAYYHTLIAQDQWGITDDRNLQKFIKIGISKDSIDFLRLQIEVLAYKSALETMKINGFESFFKKFDNDSLNILLTITRDSLAFSQALNEDSWEAYEDFFITYPNSLQKDSAKQSYHRLIFEEKANNRSEAEIEDFLQNVNDTPYRDNLEKQLLLHYTVANTPESYLKFIRSYPNSSSKKFAFNALYHFSKRNENFVFPEELMSD